MKDRTRPPGFHFVGLRVRRAMCELLGEPAEAGHGLLDVNYTDQVSVSEQMVTVRQTIQVQVLDPKEEGTAYLRALVELEGRFQGTANTNLTAEDFGNNHAPAILFAFSREWIHKLTSEAHPWPPILLPPVNVLELRKQQASAAPKVRVRRKQRT